jgi:S-adenosylhomocysteine hydrolase
LNSCESDRSACDCYETADGVKEKISNGEIPNDISEDELQAKYMKGCEWIKAADESVILDELSDCPKYKKRHIDLGKQLKNK